MKLQKSFSSNSGSSTQNDNNNIAFLLPQNPVKVVRNQIFQIFSYFDSIIPNLHGLHSFVSLWRIFQFLFPSLLVANGRVWNQNSIEFKVLSIISVLFHLIPVEYREGNGDSFCLAYMIIFIFLFLLIFISVRIFKKRAKVPLILSFFISVSNTTIALLLNAVMFNFVGETIGRMINGSHSDSTAGLIVFDVFSILCHILYMVLFIEVTVTSFMFRPISLMTILDFPQIIFTISVNFISLLTGLGSTLDNKYASCALSIVAAIVYGLTAYVTFMPGTFVKIIHQKLIFTSSITGAIMLLFFTVYNIIERKASFPEILVFIGLFIVIYLISNIIFQKVTSRHMLMLDMFQDASITIDDFKSVGYFQRCAITGMSNAHPICIDWKVFRIMTDKWHDNASVWIIFGKFVALYPSQSGLLNHIVHNMLINKKTSHSSIGHLITQARQIEMQRESTLSLELKSKLSNNSKHVQLAKRKMRRIWDQVIQGNITDMESSVSSAYNAVNKARSNFNHLLTQYPNNRFVARAYVRFIGEIEGNPTLYNEWSEKVRLLQRGIFINSDRTSLLGFHAFPNLPENLIDSAGSNFNTFQGLADSESNFVEQQEIETTIEQSQVNVEQLTIIKSNVDTLKIPSILCIKIWNFFLLFVLFYLPIIAMLLYTQTFIDEMTLPMNFMYHLSKIRSLTFQLPIFSYHYILEELNIIKKPIYEWSPASYGYHTDTKGQIQYLLTEATNSIEKLNQFSGFKTTDVNIKIANDLCFGKVIPFEFYIDNSFDYSVHETSLQGSMTAFSMQVNNLLALEEMNSSIFNSPLIKTPYLNSQKITDLESEALTALSNYLGILQQDTTNLILFICMFICIVYVLIIIGLMIFELDNLQKNKLIIYKCLTTLPKNIVSNVSESLRNISKNVASSSNIANNKMAFASDFGNPEANDKLNLLKNENGELVANKTTESNDEDTELNKQQDNIMKIFASASDVTNTSSIEQTIFIVLRICFLMCALASTILLGQIFPQAVGKLDEYGPHLDFVLGSAGYLIGSVGTIINTVCTIQGCGLDRYDVINNETRLNERIADLIERARSRGTKFEIYYQNSRFGGESNDEPPYPQFKDAIRDASNQNNCSSNQMLNLSKSFRESYFCYSADVKISLTKPFMMKVIEPIAESAPNYKDASVRIEDNDLVDGLWHLSAFQLYDNLYYPMFSNIVSELQNMINETIPTPRTVIIILLVLGFIISLIVLYEVNLSQNKLKFALGMLYHVPPAIVFQTPKIMDVLTGDFTYKSRDVTTRNDEFYNAIVHAIPDSVIVANNQGLIQSINKATERILNVKLDDIMNKSIGEFFVTNCFSFDEGVDFSTLEYDRSVTCKYKNESEKNNSYLNISKTLINQDIVVMIRDQTQTVSYNNLICEERTKSDQLLSSILPPTLVKKVQNGEKNISFAVQSSTILFLDIVEFTPWCASNTAAIVMSTLNTFYREFDILLAGHSTMTKIKCIGDCYMAAGGIFVEINQPAVHAKEVVEFGLETINYISEFDLKTNNTIKIRVGVNTGGPIVAGVLGTEKPTFEILGPAINMAQQMEHHGIPMKVHISRSTYEMIYGGNFDVAERGLVEIKNGKVNTYIVQRKNH